jgi:mono/diheme cytochrome c family protein
MFSKQLTSTAYYLLPTAYFFLVAICLLQGCDGRDTKFQQYFVEGEQLYLKNCSNCHQKNGKGLGLVYPPLAPSDFMDKNFDAVICLIKKGGKMEMTVNGNMYNQPMPGVSSLTELEIAEISTYIYNNWGHEEGIIDVKRVGKAMQTCVME